MKKTIIITTIIALLGVCAFLLFNNNTKNEPTINPLSTEINTNTVETQTANTEPIPLKEIKRDTWCVTFQLVWNDLMDTLLDGKPVKFIGGNPPLADKLNKKLYTKEILNEKSYYTKHGEISPSLKEEIETDIYKKFKETSDILHLVDWKSQGYLFYSMLLKNFNFEVPFDILPAKTFNGSSETYKFFGTKEDTKKEIRNNVAVLFYDNDKNFAVQLKTKENEDVLLYRTDKEGDFETIFEEITKKSFINNLRKTDFLSIPNIKVDELISFDELTNKQIEGTDYLISQALQTIKFNIDNKGGKLKSEAMMAVKMTMARPEETEERYFHFDKPFYLFLKEADKDKPYYAMYVKDTKYLQKGE